VTEKLFFIIMSSEKYEIAKDEVDSIIEKLTADIKKTEVSQGEAKKRLVQVCSGHFEDLEKAVDEMEREARSAPLLFRAEMIADVKKCRKEVASLQSQFTKARVDRMKELGGGHHVNINVPVQDQYRQQVLAGTEILMRTGDSLGRAQQVAIETEDVGNEIIHDLGSQREALVRTRDRLVETDLEMSRSRKILRKMYANVFSNKIILILIIVIEIGILGGVIYYRYGK